jgi:hypothetical protein
MAGWWSLLASPLTTPAADLWETLGLRKKSRGLANLTEQQITAGLKEALAQGVQQAVTNLGRIDGFLKDAKVQIPMPSSLQWAEKALRAVGQEQVTEQFVTTLNRAAEQATPAAASVLGNAVRQMTLSDARTILTSTNTTAATEFFRRTSETELQQRLLPLVKSATEQTGVTASYKRLLNQASMGSGGTLASLGRSVLGVGDLDLDTYVTQKALDGLFLKIAEEEQRIRADPTARTTELLQKVFGPVTR